MHQHCVLKPYGVASDRCMWTSQMFTAFAHKYRSVFITFQYLNHEFNPCRNFGCYMIGEEARLKSAVTGSTVLAAKLNISNKMWKKATLHLNCHLPVVEH